MAEASSDRQDTPSLLDSGQWSALGGLMFVARRLVDGLYAGPHASVRHGQGLEFHDYRPYTPGDNLREVDWKLYGRTDRPYLKRYRQQTDMAVHLLVDCSASMQFSGLKTSRSRTAGPTKLEYAKSMAAAIAFLAVRQSDRVSVTTYADRLIEHVPAGSTWAHLKRTCATLENAKAKPGRGALGACLRQTHAMLQNRRAGASHARGGLLVVVGDMLDEPDEILDGLSLFRHDRFEAIALQVLTPQELDLEDVPTGPVQWIDSESREQVTADRGSVVSRYRSLIREHISSVRRGCLARNVDHDLITTDQSVPDALGRYLVKRSSSQAAIR